MSGSVLFENEFLRISIGSDGAYVETFKRGFPLNQLPSILAQHPEVGVTSLSVLRNAINDAPKKPEKFGELRERISISISDDELSASVTFNLPPEELSMEQREKLIRDTMEGLARKGVTFGIREDVLKGDLSSGKPYPIAQGTAPIDGRDAVVRMYELMENKPEVRDDGRVDFYELRLINRVKAGDWLGERLEATEGYPGQSVKGTPIRPVKGKTVPLNFDKNSVQEVFDNVKTSLYARINGAVHYTNGKISISNHLDIDGDVGLSTGNVKFDGYVTIKGTVCDGFSVEATRDIEINGVLGLGNVKSIVSTGGSIFIKGGISSKGRVEIRAARNVFIKFVDNANIVSGGVTHIGYYCINSNVQAREFVLDASGGQIIGGHVKAQIRIAAPVIGSEIEKKTVVEVTGFHRTSMLESLDAVLHKISELKGEQQKLKQALAALDGSTQMSANQRKEYSDNNERLFEVREQIKELEEERKNIAGYLRARGEGEITVAKRIFPNCTLIVKAHVVEVTSPVLAITYYVQDHELKQL